MKNFSHYIILAFIGGTLAGLLFTLFTLDAAPRAHAEPGRKPYPIEKLADFDDGCRLYRERHQDTIAHAHTIVICGDRGSYGGQSVAISTD
jgi:hypothetical protein